MLSGYRGVSARPHLRGRPHLIAPLVLSEGKRDSTESYNPLNITLAQHVATRAHACFVHAFYSSWVLGALEALVARTLEINIRRD